MAAGTTDFQLIADESVQTTPRVGTRGGAAEVEAGTVKGPEYSFSLRVSPCRERGRKESLQGRHLKGEGLWSKWKSNADQQPFGGKKVVWTDFRAGRNIPKKARSAPSQLRKKSRSLIHRPPLAGALSTKPGSRPALRCGVSAPRETAAGLCFLLSMRFAEVAALQRTPLPKQREPKKAGKVRGAGEERPVKSCLLWSSTF